MKPFASVECLFDDCISEVRWGLDGYTLVCSSSTAQILVLVLDSESFPPAQTNSGMECSCVNMPDELASFLRTATPESVNNMSGGFGFGLPQSRNSAISNEQIQTMQQTTVVGGRKRIMPVMETSQGELKEMGDRVHTPTALPSLSTHPLMGTNPQPELTRVPHMSVSTGNLLRPDLAMMSPSVPFMPGTLSQTGVSNPLEESIEIIRDQSDEIMLAESTQQTVAKTG